MNSDNQNLYNERIKLWDDFNHAWLAIFQRQKEMMESGQPVQRPQSLISQDGLQKMGKDLVRLCDSIERHGLVDYQYGVWEEQIIESVLYPSSLVSCSIQSFSSSCHKRGFVDVTNTFYGSSGGVFGSLRSLKHIRRWRRRGFYSATPLSPLTFVQTGNRAVLARFNCLWLFILLTTAEIRPFFTFHSGHAKTPHVPPDTNLEEEKKNILFLFCCPLY